MMTLLRESHEFRNNDKVFVYLRKKPDIIYQGQIYNILKNPFQPGIPNSPIIDYFYISFRSSIYHKLLLRGTTIIYKHDERIIDHIEYSENRRISKIYLQSKLFGEIPMDLNDKICITVDTVDAVLIWRVAYCITNTITTATNMLSKL